MRKGNIIAFLVIIPFVVVVYILLTTAGTHVKHEGALIICTLLSVLSLPFSTGYLIITNADYIGDTKIVKFTNRHITGIRTTIWILGLIVFVIIFFVPKPHNDTAQSDHPSVQRRY